MSKEIEKQFFNDLIQIIEQGKNQLAKQVNSTITMVYWHLGKKINNHVLENKRAEYGKQIVSTVSAQLVKLYGRSFTERNLRRMMQFAEEFSDISIVTSLMTKLSCSKCTKMALWSPNTGPIYHLKPNLKKSYTHCLLKQKNELKEENH